MTIPYVQGRGVIAINAWYDYHNVIAKAIEINAGKEMTIQAEPVVHLATNDFKRLGEDQMECRAYDHKAKVGAEAFFELIYSLSCRAVSASSTAWKCVSLSAGSGMPPKVLDVRPGTSHFQQILSTARPFPFVWRPQITMATRNQKLCNLKRS